MILNACDACYKTECASQAVFNLEINDEISGETLLTNTDSTYHTDNIFIGAIINGEIIPGLFYEGSSTIDSKRLVCELNLKPDVVILELSPQETDTLRFESTLFENDCCSFYQLDSVSINNGPMMTMQTGVVTILK